MMRFARILLFVLAWAVPTYAADIAFPPLTGRVVDQARVLSAGAVAQLTAQLQAHEQATGQQVVVATVSSLQEHEIADYGYQLGRAWGIGQKDKNTGAILLVAPAERKVRIEVGYGLEGTLTDAQSRLIIEREILPAFRAGQMAQGILQGTTAMLAVLRGDPDAVRQSRTDDDPGSEMPSVVMLIFFILVMLMRSRSRRLFPVMMGGPTIWRGGGFGGPHGGGRRGGRFSGRGGSFGGGGASGSW